MPRFFFHSQDGRVFHDDEGVELEGIDQAKRTALNFLGESLRNNDSFWGTASFQVTVTDAQGLVLFTLDLTGTLSPAAGG